jgi:hypothetical protein
MGRGAVLPPAQAAIGRLVVTWLVGMGAFLLPGAGQCRPLFQMMQEWWCSVAKCAQAPLWRDNLTGACSRRRNNHHGALLCRLKGNLHM